MRLSIIIPTHRRPQSLLDLISSIRNQSLPLDQFEVLVVSNLPDPFLKTKPFLDLMEPLQYRVLTVGQLGVNRARNLGIKESHGDLLLLLDDDCELSSFDYLKRLVQAHERFPEALAIGGVYKLPQDVALPDVAYHVVARAWQEPSYSGDYRSWRLVGGNVSYKAKPLASLGVQFAEDIVFGGAESEFHHRLEMLGQVGVLLSSLEVTHRTRLTEQELWRKAIAQAQTRRRYGFASPEPPRNDRAYLTQQSRFLRQTCPDLQQFEDALLAVESFDHVFQLAQQEISPRRVLASARKWVRQRSRELREGRA